MGFSKATVAGFAVGFIAAVGVSMIRVPRPTYLVRADKKERLDKKEAMARINSLGEEREILLAIMTNGPTEPFPYMDDIRLLAMTDSRWGKILHDL